MWCKRWLSYFYVIPDAGWLFDLNFTEVSEGCCWRLLAPAPVWYSGFDKWWALDHVFSEDDDATDADEMTTFDGSTISLSLSPMMTPVKGDYPFAGVGWRSLGVSLGTCRNLSTLFPHSFPRRCVCWQTEFPTGRITWQSWRRIWAWRYPSWA